MKSFTPTIYNYRELAGFDYEISAVQAKLARISWMEYIFGRATTQYRIRTDENAQNFLNPPEGLRGRDKYAVYYPQGRKLDQDIDLSFDDSYASRCFFYTHDPINANPKTDDFDWTAPNIEVSQPFSLIFSADLSKLETTSSEIIKTGILYALGQCP